MGCRSNNDEEEEIIVTTAADDDDDYDDDDDDYEVVCVTYDSLHLQTSIIITITSRAALKRISHPETRRWLC